MSTTFHESDVVWSGTTPTGDHAEIRRLANTLAFALLEGPLDSPEFTDAIARFVELSDIERLWVWSFLAGSIVNLEDEDRWDRVKLVHIGVSTLVVESGQRLIELGYGGSWDPGLTSEDSPFPFQPSRELL